MRTTSSLCVVWFVSMLQPKGKLEWIWSFIGSETNQTSNRLFIESADAFSLFILVQLMTSMLMLSGSIFQLDLVRNRSKNQYVTLPSKLHNSRLISLCSTVVNFSKFIIQVLTLHHCSNDCCEHVTSISLLVIMEKLLQIVLRKWPIACINRIGKVYQLNCKNTSFSW